jgi:hypothetical protein
MGNSQQDGGVMNERLNRHLESRQKLKKKQIINSILKKRKRRDRSLNYFMHVDSMIRNNPMMHVDSTLA